MDIICICVGKTTEAYLKEPCNMYVKRIGRYFPITWIETSDIKSLPPIEMKQREADLVLKQLQPTDQIYLMDADGQQHSSQGFSKFLQAKQDANTRRLVFVIGGAHGFADTLYAKATGKISLSAMTFTHQMVRLILLEQIYRACTIMRNEPYHH